MKMMMMIPDFLIWKLFNVAIIKLTALNIEDMVIGYWFIDILDWINIKALVPTACSSMMTILTFFGSRCCEHLGCVRRIDHYQNKHRKHNIWSCRNSNLYLLIRNRVHLIGFFSQQTCITFFFQKLCNKWYTFTLGNGRYGHLLYIAKSIPVCRRMRSKAYLFFNPIG